MTVAIPKWISIVSFLIALLALFVGCSLYLSPATFIEGIDFSSPNIKFLANMWAARQIAIGGVIAFSVLKKSSQMLMISLSAYCLMNIQDAIIGILKSDSGLAIGASFFCLLSASMILVLIKASKQYS
jgi:hypothetical protein